MAQGQDLGCEVGASSEAGPHGRWEGSDASMHTGARYQQRAVSSIATRSTQFSVGTGRREAEPVSPRHGGTAGSSPEYGEFVPHDDFQVFELVRLNAQDRQLQHPPKRRVTEREEHETSEPERLFYASASDSPFAVVPGAGRRNLISSFFTLDALRAD